MLITLLVATDCLPPTQLLLAGISAVSRLPAVRNVHLTRTPLQYHLEVEQGADPASLAAALADSLDLPVHVQAGNGLEQPGQHVLHPAPGPRGGGTGPDTQVKTDRPGLSR